MAKKENLPLEQVETSQAVNINSETQISQAIDIKKIQDPTTQIWIEKLRVELAKLGLRIIEDLSEKRVSKPEETYNSLVALYNAVKN